MTERVSYAVLMTWRHSIRKRCGAVVIAVAMGGLVPAGSVWADRTVEPVATSPDDGGDQTPDQPVDDSTPETGEVDGANVAVGAPPVPPVSDESPQVAVGQPPVPPVSESPQVAVGQPPVPPVSESPQVAVGQPPVPPAALFETVSAALDLVADCL